MKFGTRIITLLVLTACLPQSGTAQTLPETGNPGYLYSIAGGEDDGAGTAALTYSLDSWITALDVDQAGRIYFENRDAISRTEIDGTISPVTYGSDVSDFHIQNNFLYYVDFSGTTYRVDLETDDSEQISALPEGSESCCGGYRISVDSNQNTYVASRVVYRTDAGSSLPYIYAGSDCGDDCSGEPYVDGTPALEAEFGWIIYDIAVDPVDGALLIAHTSELDRVARVDPVLKVMSVVADDVYIRSQSLPALRMDVLAGGDIVYADQESHVWRIPRIAGVPYVIAGDGVSTTAGDGNPLLGASMLPQLVAVGPDDNIVINSAIREPYAGRIIDQRIRLLDLDNDLVSSKIGAPGLLACQSPTDSHLQEVSGITVDPNGTTYITANSAILAIDTKLDILYSVAGLYGTYGKSDDGIPAFGNPIATDGVDYLAAAPNGDIYFTEIDRLRRISFATGLLETLVEGQFRWMDFNAAGDLFAVRQYYRASFDFIEAGPPDFTRINTRTGVVEELVVGGEAPPVLDESAQGRDFRALTDFAADSSGTLYVLLGFDIYGVGGAPPGLYRIEPQTGTLRAVPNGEAISNFEFQRLALDEERGFIYLSGGYGFGTDDGDVPVARYDLQSGELLRFAGAPSGGNGYSENPLEADLDPIALDLDSQGELYLVDRSTRADAQYVLQITASRRSSELIPEDITAGSNVGETVARSDNWLAIGVPNSGTGNGTNGEVLVYRDNGCSVILRNRLKVPDGFTAQSFGKQVAFSGRSLVVSGQSGQDQATRNESTMNDSSYRLGVFGLDDRIWVFNTDLSGFLPPETTGANTTLVASGDLFAVGSPDADGGKGSVIVFDINALQSPVSVPPAGSATRFGRSLAISDSRLAVGASTVQGAGLAALYQQNQANFQLSDLVGAEDERPGFATALALNDQSLYSGSPDPSGGRVYDYAIDGGFLFLADELSDPLNPSSPSFGASLAIEDDLLVVGAPETEVPEQLQASKVKAIGGLSDTKTSHGFGLVQVFGIKDRTGKRQPGFRLTSLFQAATEGYGSSVDISKGRIVVGAPQTQNSRGSFDSVREIVDAADLSGLWYNPELDGEGFNVLIADAGLVVYFYGYDSSGERLWLVTETLVADFGFGEEVDLRAFKARRGDFDSPVPSDRSLVEYGLISVSFGSLDSARFTVTGFDGSKFSSTVFLADAGANEAAFSGLWYDPQKDGEGFNVISGGPGTVIYYYGSSSEGERLWLISDLLSNNVENGAVLRGRMFEATGGDFYHPAPTNTALRDWGSIEARFDDCLNGRFVLEGNDGDKTSGVFKLAGVQGAECN
jgi:hypothetical protein